MILFVRHGETDYNKLRIYQGRLDINLNETGVLQAHQAKENLKNIRIDEIYASPLKRALKTAEIINENYQLKITTDDRLKECDCGKLEGVCTKDFSKEKWEYIHNNPEVFEMETPKEIFERVISFFKEIENSDKNILIVSHGGVYRAIYKYLNNIEGYNFDAKQPKNSEIIRLK